MQCKMLVVSSELEERSDMRESREIEVVIWVYTSPRREEWSGAVNNNAELRQCSMVHVVAMTCGCRQHVLKRLPIPP